MAEAVVLVDVHTDLTVTVRKPDNTTEVVTFLGLEIPVAPEGAPPETTETRTPTQAILTELLGEKGMRLATDAHGDQRDDHGRRRVYMEYYAWKDKSGTVWRDAGEQLIAMGHGIAATTQDFERKVAYQRAEQTARDKGFGRWKAFLQR